MDCKSCILLYSVIILSIFSGSVRSHQTRSNDGRFMTSFAAAGGRKFLRPTSDSNSYCESWKFTVENNDAGKWSTVPSRCKLFVKNYMTGDRYLSDSKFVADDSISFAKNFTITGDGLDCWVFDIDETLLSNLPYYAEHGYGSEKFNVTAVNEWSEKAKAPALPETLRLYNELHSLNFTLVLLTGRRESIRNVTVKNLLFAGYKNWHKLILRGKSDEGKTALVYKSSKRKELEDEGYRIHGSSGDQWSDLLGNATAVRSFKLPNLMYYIA